MCLFRLFGFGKMDVLWQKTLFPVWFLLLLLILFCWLARRVSNKYSNCNMLKKTMTTLCKIVVSLELLSLALFDLPWSLLAAVLFRKKVAKCLVWLGVPCEKIRFFSKALQTEYSVNERKVHTLFLIFYAPVLLIGILAWRYIKTAQMKYPVKEYLDSIDAIVDDNARSIQCSTSKTSFNDIIKWSLIILFFPYSFIYLWFEIEKKKRQELYEAEKKMYEETSYFVATKVPFDTIRTVNDKSGRRGEYLLYQEIRVLEESGAKYLFNTYIPKWDGTTTEVDIICVSSYGIFVFESKDYSGWIFGEENQREWTQTHRSKQSVEGVHKQKFYNPVMQNQAHIRYLRSFLHSWNEFPIWSIVVFSDECTLKKVNIHSKDIHVIQQHQVRPLINGLIADKQPILSAAEIESIYSVLYPLTQVGDDVKNKHNEQYNIPRK